MNKSEAIREEIKHGIRNNKREILPPKSIKRILEIIDDNNIEEEEKPLCYSVLIVHTNKYMMQVKGLSKEEVDLLRVEYFTFRESRKDKAIAIGDMEREQLIISLSEIASIKIMPEREEA